MASINKLLNAVDRLTGHFLSAEVVDFDMTAPVAVSMAVRMHGKVRTHPVGADRESGGFDWHFEPVDHVEHFQFAKPDKALVCRAVASALLHVEGTVIDAVADGLDWTQTLSSLNYQVAHV